MAFWAPFEESKVLFIVEATDSHAALANWCFGNLRRHHRTARTIMIIEGRRSRNLESIAKAHNIEAYYGEPLWVGQMADSGKLWKRRIDYFLASQAKYLLRFDTDTGFCRPLTQLPIPQCVFGSVARRTGIKFIQGGLIGMTREVAKKVIQPEILAEMSTWKHYPNGVPFASDDRALRVLHRLKVRFERHGEIFCQYKGKVENSDKKYAIIHPCKDQRL